MAIETTRNGRQRVRLGSRARRVTLGTCATRDDAETLEREGRAARDEAGQPTLDATGLAWLKARELEGVRGFKTELGRWRTHVSGTRLGKTPLDLLSPALAEAWLRNLQQKSIATPRHTPRPLSPKTVREAVVLVRAAIRAARMADPFAELGDAVKRATRRRGAAATVEPWTYLEQAEQVALATCAAIPEADRLIVAFAMLTGLRQGEQTNLELADVHADHVVVRFGSKGQPPKNGRIRRVFLSDQAKRVVARWREVLPRTWAPSNPEKLMFPTRGGSRCQRGKHPLCASVWDREAKKTRKVDRFALALRTAGVARSVRWHDLRHTCASSLVAGWWGRRWTLEEVGAHLGHESLQSTHRYAHLAESAVARAIADTHWRAPECARRDSKEGEGLDANVGICLVGRQGLEPWTYGLKAPSDPEGLQELRAKTGTKEGTTVEKIARAFPRHVAGQLAERARIALAALDAGDPYAQRMLATIIEELVELVAVDEDLDVAGGSS